MVHIKRFGTLVNLSCLPEEAIIIPSPVLLPKLKITIQSALPNGCCWSWSAFCTYQQKHQPRYLGQIVCSHSCYRMKGWRLDEENSKLWIIIIISVNCVCGLAISIFFSTFQPNVQTKIHFSHTKTDFSKMISRVYKSQTEHVHFLLVQLSDNRNRKIYKWEKILWIWLY